MNLRRVPLRPEVQQNVAIVGFVLALVGAGLVVYPSDQSRRAAVREWNAERVKRERMEAEQLPSLPKRLIAVTADPQEPAQAVAELRLLAFRSGCAVVSFDAIPGRVSEDDAVVWPERIRLEIRGPFPRIREFMVRLVSGNRMMSVPEFSISRAPGQRSESQTEEVTAQMRIERYVTAVPMQAEAIVPNPPDTP